MKPTCIHTGIAARPATVSEKKVQGHCFVLWTWPLLFGLCFIAGLVSFEAIAQPLPIVTDDPPARTWNLQDADILSVINEVSQETGKSFVVDPRVSGKITLVSSRPIKQADIYHVFLSVLGLLGYSAVPEGNVVKILPNMESGEQATAVADKRAPGKGEEVVVRVVPLDNVSATQLIPVVRPMLPQWSNVSAYTPGNVLVLIGKAANLQRIVHVIQDIDKGANASVQMVRLHHASAVQVATVLNNLQNAARATGEVPAVSIAVDERSNSILLSGPKAMRVRLRLLISELDAPSSSSGNTEVIYLRYLQSKTFAPLLSRIAQNMLGKGSKEPTGDSTMAFSATSMGSMVTNLAKDTGGGGQSTIQHEPSTNALIITATPTLMRALKSVIAKLDIRPAQVLVEAIFAQIDESNLRSLGIQWGTLTKSGQVEPTTSGAITDFPNLAAGVFGIIPGRQIRAVLSLLENQNGVDILSTPQIVVLDNQKATIEVGQDVPEQTGAYSTTGTTGTVTPFNTIGRKKVTLKLDVTPQINLGSSVRLTLDLKNDTLQNPDNPGLNPLINTSEIKNSVIVKSDDILVLGGLISNTTNENVNKVPILGDLPAIGLLFQQKSRKLEKKNLMVFIKPIIIQEEDCAMAITHQKYTSIQRTQANFRDDLAELPKEKKLMLLPPWKNSHSLPTPFAEKPHCPSGRC